MKQLTIPEIKDLDDGDPIGSFEVTLTKVYPQKDGPGKYGRWYLQNCEAEDEHGDQIDVTWTGEDSIENLEGETVLFESNQTKYGWRGIERDIRSVKGKRYEGIKVTGVATLTINGKKADLGGRPRRREEDDDRSPRRHEERPEREHSAPAPKKKVRTFADLIYQVDYVYGLCLDAAVAQRADFEKRHETKMADSQFQVMTSAYFIHAKDNGMIERVPLPKEPEAPPQRRAEPEPDDSDIPF